MSLDRDLCDRCMSEWLPDDARAYGITKAEILESLGRRGLVRCRVVSDGGFTERRDSPPEGCPYLLEHVVEGER